MEEVPARRYPSGAHFLRTKVRFKVNEITVTIKQMAQQSLYIRNCSALAVGRSLKRQLQNICRLQFSLDVRLCFHTLLETVPAGLQTHVDVEITVHEKNYCTKCAPAAEKALIHAVEDHHQRQNELNSSCARAEMFQIMPFHFTALPCDENDIVQ